MTEARRATISLIDAKFDRPSFRSTEDSPFAGVYLPYHLGDAAADGQVFVKIKTTRSTVTWRLDDGGTRIVMKENRETGRVERVVVMEDDEVTLRLRTGAPVQADDVREQVATLGEFDTRPFIPAFAKAEQRVFGSDGEDHLRAGHRDDRIKTGADDDTYVAGRGDDMVELGGGEDLADYSELKGRIVADLRKGFVKKGGRDRDEVSGVEDVTGARKADVLRGDGRQNELTGMGGDDLIKGRAGEDRLGGSAGDDRVIGGRGNDTLFGDEGDDRLFGGLGDDALFGGAGKDRLIGGAGGDTLEGGDGADVFVLSASPGAGGPDQVRDYNPAEGDKLQLPGAASDYETAEVNGSTEIRRDGEAVAVLLDIFAPFAVEDALFS